MAVLELFVIGAGAFLTGLGEDAVPAAPLPVGPPLPPNWTPPPAVSQDAREIEALDRTIASEAEGGSAAEQRAIGWTVRNRFTGRGASIAATQLPPRQQNGSDPPFSSDRPGTAATRAIALQVLSAPAGSDPTGGATAFFEPKLQDVLVRYGVQYRAAHPGGKVRNPSMIVTQANGKPLDISRFYNYNKPAAQIRSDWTKGGDRLLATVGRFEFYGRPAKGLSGYYAAASGSVDAQNIGTMTFRARRPALAGYFGGPYTFTIG